MKVLMQHRPIERLSKSDLKMLASGKPSDEIAGTVISGDQATAKVLRGATIRWSLIAVFACGVIIAPAFVGAVYKFSDASPAAKLIIILAGLAALAIGAAVPRWQYRRAARLWIEHLPERVAAMPAPGTEVRLDAIGVSIGSRAGSWSQLRIDQLELVDGGDEVRSLRIERLMLTGAGALMTLDSDLIENGPQMVQTACRRLLPREA